MYHRTRLVSLPWSQGIVQSAVAAAPLFTYDFFVAPGGGTGTGSIADPWSITYAMGQGPGSAQGDGKLPVTGAHVGMRAGVYNVSNLLCNAHGVLGSGVDNADGKLIFRNYNGERANIFGVLPVTDHFTVSADYVWFWGLELSRDWANRTTPINAGAGAWIYQTNNGVKFIHCYGHDGQNCFYISTENNVDSQGRVELYGNLCFNNGWDGSLGSGGHHVYAKHKGTGNRLAIEHNIFGTTFNYCQQLYGTAGAGLIEGVDSRWNVHFNGYVLSGGTWPRDGNLVVIGGELALNDVNFDDNYGYWPNGYGDVGIIAGWRGDLNNGPLRIRRPYFIGGGSGYGVVRVKGRFIPQSNLTLDTAIIRPDGASGNRYCVRVEQTNPVSGFGWTTNTWIRLATTTSWNSLAGQQNFANWKTATGIGASDTATATDPASTLVVVDPTTRYEAGRGHVWYYNWAGLNPIPVNLSPILSPGDNYVVHDARSGGWGAPVLSGVYGGGFVNFPNTQMVDPVPTGGAPNVAPATAPFFNVFLVRKI